MSGDGLSLAGVGMVTPLGDGAHASCAALRAGISRFQEMPWIELHDRDELPVVPVGALVREWADGYSGLGRFTRLAANALRDLFEQAAVSPSDLASAGMYVALPAEGRAGVDPRVHTQLGARLHEWLGLRAALSMKVSSRGHAGFADALSAAARDLASKRVQRAIVGGVDSLVDAATVRWLFGAKRLKAGDRPVGLFPGEGAAFALIETAAATRLGAARITIEGVAVASEGATIDKDAICTGAGLGEAIRRTLSALPDRGEALGLVVSDMNGEPYRSEEMGYAMTRALSPVKTPFRLWHAADSIGDSGAAAPAIGLGMAARALRKGYAKTDTALVVASSDGGLRGSFAVRRSVGNAQGAPRR